jgi:site-specific recombinase XerD
VTSCGASRAGNVDPSVTSTRTSVLVRRTVTSHTAWPTGVAFDPHWLRHTYATGLLRAGTPLEVVSKLLGHASVTNTAPCSESSGSSRAGLMRAN